MKSIRPFALTLIACFGLLAWSSIKADAQASPLPPIPSDYTVGLTPFQSYHGGAFDKVDMFNGNLHFNIPLVSYPQRGGKLKIQLGIRYNGKLYKRSELCPETGPNVHKDPYSFPGNCVYGMQQFNPSPSGQETSPITSGLQFVDQQDILNFTPGMNLTTNAGQDSVVVWPMEVVTADGSMHYGDQVVGTNYQETFDGTGIMLALPNTATTSHICTPITDADGVQHFESPQDGFITVGDYECPVLRQDADGNQILATYDSHQNLSAMTDTLGRTIPMPPPPVSLASQPEVGGVNYTQYCPNVSGAEISVWQVPGQAGSSQTFVFCWAPQTVSFPTSLCGTSAALTATPLLMTTIVLPNFTTWQFAYDSWGDISQITLPTGGVISYTYSMWSRTLSTCSATVVTRTVNAEDGSGPQKWTYTWGSGPYPPSSSAPYGSFVNTVTDPLGDVTEHTYSGNSPYESEQRDYQKGTGGLSLLRTIDTSYAYQTNLSGDESTTGVALPIQVNTTLDDGRMSQKKTGYTSAVAFSGVNGFTGAYGVTPGSNTYGFENDVQEFDYGAVGSSSPGPLLKETKTTYLWSSSTAYQSANLLHTPSSVTITNGSNVTVEGTSYTYDESSCAGIKCSGNASGASTQFSPPAAGTPLGHDTSTTHTLTGGTSPVTHTAWYDDGEKFKDIDANGNVTTYNYSPVYDYAYVTTITNALGQSRSFTYDPTTGLKASETDENNQTTSYTYDGMNRLTNTTYPDTYLNNGSTHGATHWTYTDSVPAKVTMSKAYAPSGTSGCSATFLSGACSIDAELDVDGLGRLTHIRQLTAPGGPFVTDITYDGLGRENSESNAYKSTSDLTYGITSVVLDMLDRPWTVTHPDGTSLQNTYSGAAVLSTDEGNGINPISKITQKNALDQIISVCEVWPSSPIQALASGSGDRTAANCLQDISGSGFLTSYTYDPLGNLLSVTQGSLPTRVFTYDTLSRLLCAYNPEYGATMSGVTACSGKNVNTVYGYDANGNMTSRTRWAPNQPASGTAQATATFGYDGLNRVTGTTYTDTYNSASPTPSVNYVYDVAIPNLKLPSQSNLVTRMSAAYTSNSSGYVAARAFGYDPMGRDQMMAECTVDDCSQLWYYEVIYGYDVNGNPQNEQLLTAAPETGFTLSYVYNGLGQMTQMTSSISDQYHPSTLLSGALYSPLGGLVSMTLGNGVVETLNYDKRNRLACETAVKGSTTLYSLALSNAIGTCSGYSFLKGNSGYSGDGNVVEYFDSVNGHWTYTYDDMNHLVASTQVAGPGPLGTNGGGMGWTYDRFGNRWSQAQTGVSTQGMSFTGGNNRVNTYTYDAVGNLLNDGLHTYTYDDENRILTATLIGGGTETYAYDAEGQRVRKTNGTTPEEYAYDKDGHQIGEMQADGNFNRIEIYGGDRHLATYENVNIGAPYAQTVFTHGDWLGTERIRSLYDGTLYQTCTNLPFGDQQMCPTVNNSADPSPMHFTGKMRDTETNLDYFGARYFSSGLGRWMSPDWASKPTGVPYANFGDPQSLNLYSYVGNNPLSRADKDGHCSGDDCGKITVTAATSGKATLTSSNGGKTATAEGTVQYTIQYGGKPLANTQVHEDISNKSYRDGSPEKSQVLTGDAPTGPNGTVTDQSNITITNPFGAAEQTMTGSVYSKDTTQILTLQSPGGSTCSVTETRTLTNADPKGKPSDDYQIKLTSPSVQTASPAPAPKPSSPPPPKPPGT